jgi:hypothetical protein
MQSADMSTIFPKNESGDRFFKKIVSLDYRFAMSRSPSKGQLWPTPHMSFFTIGTRMGISIRFARLLQDDRL